MIPSIASSRMPIISSQGEIPKRPEHAPSNAQSLTHSMLRKSPSPTPSHGSSLSVDMDKWCWDSADEIALTLAIGCYALGRTVVNMPKGEKHR